MGTKSGQHDSRTSFNLFYNFALCIIPLEVMHIPNAVIGGWYNVISFKSNLVNRRVNIASRRFVHNLGNIEMAILHSTYTLQAFEQCRCTSPMTTPDMAGVRNQYLWQWRIQELTDGGRSGGMLPREILKSKASNDAF